MTVWDVTRACEQIVDAVPLLERFALQESRRIQLLPQDAADVLQCACLRILELQAKNEGLVSRAIQSPPWLRMMARVMAYEHRRALGPGRTMLRDLSQVEDRDRRAGRSLPSLECVARDNADLLTTRQVDAFVAISNFRTNGEAASAIGCGERALRARLSRGVQALANRFQPPRDGKRQENVHRST